MGGRGEFVADIRLPGMLEIAYSRSPLAHARIAGIAKPAGQEDCVFTHADLAGVAPIRAVAGLPGFKASEQPVLATGKVRHVGEMIGMCVADTQAAAEDLAAEILVDFAELPVVADTAGLGFPARYRSSRALPAGRRSGSKSARTTAQFADNLRTALVAGTPQPGLGSLDIGNMLTRVIGERLRLWFNRLFGLG